MMLCYSKTRKIKYFLDPPPKKKIDSSAIVNDRLSALELATTPDMGHDGWASDVTLSNIHERSFIYIAFSLI